MLSIEEYSKLKKSGVKGGETEKSHRDNQDDTKDKGFQNTLPNPPSFLQKDLDKRQEKFSYPLKDRGEYKRKHYKDVELTPLTVNTNLVNPDLMYNSYFPKSTSSGFNTAQTSAYTTVESQGAHNGEYKRVMQRRKSRLSTCAPVTVDFEYAGDSAKF